MTARAIAPVAYFEITIDGTPRSAGSLTLNHDAVRPHMSSTAGRLSGARTGTTAVTSVVGLTAAT